MLGLAMAMEYWNMTINIEAMNWRLLGCYGDGHESEARDGGGLLVVATGDSVELRLPPTATPRANEVVALVKAGVGMAVVVDCDGGDDPIVATGDGLQSIAIRAFQFGVGGKVAIRYKEPAMATATARIDAMADARADMESNHARLSSWDR